MSPRRRLPASLPQAGRKAVVNDALTDALVRHFGDELHGLGLRRFADLRDLVTQGTALDEAYAWVVRDRREDCDC
jgi:hypothetical protein